MHELAVCQELMRQVATLAQERLAERVTSIVVRVGPLSGVESSLLASAFQIARAGTVAADARLLVETAPVRVHCSMCGAVTEAAANRLLCSACDSWRTEVASGDELLLVSVELEKSRKEVRDV
jgi:hydrogenase nickel incorporation protein HypA/HybF